VKKRMDQDIIVFGAIALGALFAVVVPALLAMHEKGEAFKISYLYGMCIPLIVGAFAAMPDEPVELTFRSILLLFLAGTGLQGIVNKGNTIRLKLK
jgi:hypothetical protein